MRRTLIQRWSGYTRVGPLSGSGLFSHWVADGGLSGLLGVPIPQMNAVLRPGVAVDSLRVAYSLGVLMYELACGRLPFAGLEGAALLSAVIAGKAAPLRQRNPALPEALVRVIARAMSMRPENRFARATDLAAALRSVEGVSAANVVPEPALPVVGVLDFEILSGDNAVDWLGTGLAETITADLRRLKAVQVVSRERVQQELRRLGGSGDMAALGAQMSARWLVTGSYQRSGNRIRITPHLLEQSVPLIQSLIERLRRFPPLSFAHNP